MSKDKDQKKKPEEAETKKQDTAPEEKKAEAKPAQAPAVSDQQIQTMSEAQKVLYNLARTAQEPRRIESIEDLAPTILMQIPEEVSDPYPERTYRWADASNMPEELAKERGLWAPVTRSNHAKAPEHLFDLATGLILYGGPKGNALTFTYRAAIEMKNKQILQDFDIEQKKLEEKMARPIKTKTGRAVAHMEQTDMGEGYGAVPLNPPDFKYDYGSPE